MPNRATVFEDKTLSEQAVIAVEKQIYAEEVTPAVQLPEISGPKNDIV
jgi:hypothetical protein